MQSFAADCRHTARALRHSPGLVLVAVLSLGLGLGVNFTLFAAINAVFFHEPDAVDLHRVVAVHPGNSNQFSYLNYRDLGDSGIFESVAGWRHVELTMHTAGDPERVTGLAVTPEFFQFLGIPTALGRYFTAAEASPGRQSRIAVVSDAFWRGRLNGEQTIVRRELLLNGEAYTVIGVLPRGYRAVTVGNTPDVYLPVSQSVLPTLDDRRNGNALTVVGRLRPGMSREQAQAAVTLLGGQLETAFPVENEGMAGPARVLPVRGGELAGSPEQYLIPTVLLTLFAVVLLIACANVAGLLMARSARRQQEIGLRVALGASRAGIVRLLLIESFGLAMLGGGAGALLAAFLTGLLRTLSIPGAGAVDLPLEPSGPAVAYALLLLAITGLLCGAAPALRLSHTNLGSFIQGGSDRVTGRLWLRHAFVVAQVAACLVLLVLSSLMLRSVGRVMSMDPGFDVEHGLVATLHVDPRRYGVDGGLGVAEEVVARLSALPGVESAAFANIVALGTDRSATGLQIEGSPAGTSPARAYVNSVSPAYFATMDIPVVRGRAFDARDRPGSPSVAIVTESFARAHLAGQDALATRIRQSGTDESFQIIGIVRDHMYGDYGDTSTPVFYTSYLQHPQVSTQVRPVIVHVRSAGPPGVLAWNVRQAIRESAPGVAADVRTLREAIGTEPALRRFGMRLLASAGILGLLLAAVGLYGLMTFTVASRVREIGVRMALGAESGVVLRGVLRQGLGLIVAGLAIGAVASLMVARLAIAMLAGLSPADPVAFGGAATLLVAVGLAACYAPARRAARLDPLVALRHL